ncbi:short chain dehydrogenase [Corallococcus macrosporus]|uniref:Short chain dehydrogenase n=2 Tax=Myxococcaceae TaxID=31 RepID=F8CPF5_MYXFH|nr:short chain dehydrogenase [Corallococcus macrosporus]
MARTREALENAAEEVRLAGGQALVLPLDVADAEAVEAAADEAIRQWGRIDIWINDAMVSVLSPVQRMEAREYRRVTEVTYLGTVHGTLAALRRMLPRDEGHIIQIGSALAYRSIPLQSAYCASKAAIRAFTDSLRSELLHDGSRVRISMPQLPAVNTPQFDVVRSRLPKQAQPVPPIYQPEVIADAVVYLSRHPTRELWIGWSTAKALLGQKLLPGVLDRYLARKGYSGQQTDAPRPQRPDNVDTPIPGDRGAHGRFDDRARTRSSQLWLREHRATLGAVAGAVVAAAGLSLARRRGKPAPFAFSSPG